MSASALQLGEPRPLETLELQQLLPRRSEDDLDVSGLLVALVVDVLPVGQLAQSAREGLERTELVFRETRLAFEMDLFDPYSDESVLRQLVELFQGLLQDRVEHGPDLFDQTPALLSKRERTLTEVMRHHTVEERNPDTAHHHGVENRDEVDVEDAQERLHADHSQQGGPPQSDVPLAEPAQVALAHTIEQDLATSALHDLIHQGHAEGAEDENLDTRNELEWGERNDALEGNHREETTDKGQVAPVLEVTTEILGKPSQEQLFPFGRHTTALLFLLAHRISLVGDGTSCDSTIPDFRNLAKDLMNDFNDPILCGIPCY